MGGDARGAAARGGRGGGARAVSFQPTRGAAAADGLAEGVGGEAAAAHAPEAAAADEADAAVAAIAAEAADAGRAAARRGGPLRSV